MSKVKIKVSNIFEGKKDCYDTIAIQEEDKIKYKELNNTTVVFDQKKKSLYRENKDLQMKYSFIEEKETEGTIKIKELNKELSIMIHTKKVRIDNKKIEIIFTIEDNEFIYQVEVLE